MKLSEKSCVMKSDAKEILTRSTLRSSKTCSNNDTLILTKAKLYQYDIILCLLFYVFPFRTSTKPSWTKRRCTSATSTNCTTCTSKPRTTQVPHRVFLHRCVFLLPWSRTDRCISFCSHPRSAHRGVVHPAALRRAAGVVGPAAAGVPQLPHAERVAEEGVPAPDHHPELRPGEGKQQTGPERKRQRNISWEMTEWTQ